jgi:uncharacterized protein (TIGR02246 family)
MDDLAQMLIERACGRLVTDYCHAIDHGEGARVAELFTEDGCFGRGRGALRGREAIAAAFGARQARAGRMSRHICANLLIEVLDERTARGVAYITLYRHDGEPGRAVSPAEAPAAVGEYRDSFARTDDGWRFNTREVHLNFVRGEPG